MNQNWLFENAVTPIRYNLTHRAEDAEHLLQNGEISVWLSRLAERSQANVIGDIHGSHDYRMENILGKCWILGLSKNIPAFAENMSFIQSCLNNHIQTTPSAELSFGKLYRDCEKVLACFLPFLGYHADPAVLHIVRKRIEVLFGFTKQKRYDIYVDGSKIKGVKKAWQPYIIAPDLYADGHIALPDMHDFLLFAGMYPFLPLDDQNKIETIAAWLFGDGYNDVIRRYGYFYAPGGSYNTKAIIFKPHLLEFQDMSFDKGDLVSLLFTVFVLSHFKTAKESVWFSLAMAYLDHYKNEAGRYSFPSHMISEKPDSYGENKKSKLYNEILSTYWIERIHQNMTGKERNVK